MASRGLVYSTKRASQLRDFSKLRFANNITPTDIDCLLEFGDEAYVIVEAKSGSKQVPFGQRLALQRPIRDFVLRGKKAILIIATHEYPPEVPIDFAECNVLEYWDGETWSNARRNWKVKQFIAFWLQENDLSKYLTNHAG